MTAPTCLKHHSYIFLLADHLIQKGDYKEICGLKEHKNSWATWQGRPLGLTCLYHLPFGLKYVLKSGLQTHRAPSETESLQTSYINYNYLIWTICFFVKHHILFIFPPSAVIVVTGRHVL